MSYFVFAGFPYNCGHLSTDTLENLPGKPSRKTFQENTPYLRPERWISPESLFGASFLLMQMAVVRSK